MFSVVEKYFHQWEDYCYKETNLYYWKNRFALRQNLPFLIEIQVIQLLQLLVFSLVRKFVSTSGKNSFYMH